MVPLLITLMIRLRSLEENVQTRYGEDMDKEQSDTPSSIQVGSVPIRVPALLAPMSGVTDYPFRKQAWKHGAGLVVSEMVACETLAQGREDVIRRMAGDVKATGPRVIQLAGREARWMDEGARIATDAGADIIDINMGCPARQVTKGLSGSALMRDLDHALTLIEATVNSTPLPVTLKMRLGWDHDTINAPDLASRAVNAGVQMITVHGRTRQQFYTGLADWNAIAAVRAAIKVPLIVNGDIKTASDARLALEASGADAVMIGRAAQGKPWLPGAIGRALQDGGMEEHPDPLTGLESLTDALTDSVELYGEKLGIRCMRKHLASFVDWIIHEDNQARQWRGALCREASLNGVLEQKVRFSDYLSSHKAA